MAITLQNEENITTGWPGPPQLQGQNLGQLVAAILHDKLQREKMSGEGIAETIKNVRLDMQSNKYIEAMKEAGLIPKDYDAGGFGGAKLGEQVAEALQRQQRIDLEGGQQKYMKPYYEAQTNEAQARADALWKYGTTGRGSSAVPRLERTLPSGDKGWFTGKQAWDIDRELKANQAMKEMVDKEAAWEVEKAKIEARRGGIDPRTYGPKDDGSPQSQADLQRWEQLDDELKKSKIVRDRYEKWYKVVSGVHGGEEPDTSTDQGVDLPPATSPPPTTAPFPTATPFPSATPAVTAQPTQTPAMSPAQQEPQPSATPTATPGHTPQRKMPPQKFGNVKDAIAAGYKVNDIILLLHPAKKTYEPYQITTDDLR